MIRLGLKRSQGKSSQNFVLALEVEQNYSERDKDNIYKLEEQKDICRTVTILVQRLLCEFAKRLGRDKLLLLNHTAFAFYFSSPKRMVSELTGITVDIKNVWYIFRVRLF